MKDKRGAHIAAAAALHHKQIMARIAAAVLRIPPARLSLTTLTEAVGVSRQCLRTHLKREEVEIVQEEGKTISLSKQLPADPELAAKPLVCKRRGKQVSSPAEIALVAQALVEENLRNPTNPSKGQVLAVLNENSAKKYTNLTKVKFSLIMVAFRKAWEEKLNTLSTPTPTSEVTKAEVVEELSTPELLNLLANRMVRQENNLALLVTEMEKLRIGHSSTPSSLPSRAVLNQVIATAPPAKPLLRKTLRIALLGPHGTHRTAIAGRKKISDLIRSRQLEIDVVDKPTKENLQKYDYAIGLRQCVPGKAMKLEHPITTFNGLTGMAEFIERQFE